MFPATSFTQSADELAVGASSAQFATFTMQPNSYYEYTANVDSWIAQSSNPTATAGAGSMFVPAGFAVTLSGNNGSTLAVIQDSSSGLGSLCEVQL